MNTVNGAGYSINVETAGAQDCIVEDCIFNYGRYGLDHAAIAGTGDPLPSVVGWVINRCTFLGMEVAAIDFDSSTVANIATLVQNCTIGMGADTANAETSMDLGSAGAINVKVTDLVADRGVQLPVSTPAE